MFGEGKATKKRFHFFGLFDPWSCNLVSGWLNSWWPSAILSKASTDSSGFQQRVEGLGQLFSISKMFAPFQF